MQNSSLMYEDISRSDNEESRENFRFFDFFSKHKTKLATIAFMGILSFGVGFFVGRHSPNYNFKFNSVFEEYETKKSQDNLFFDLNFGNNGSSLSIDSLLFAKHEDSLLRDDDAKRDKLEDYLQKFSGVDFDSKWKVKHAMRIYGKYSNFLDETCNLYGVPKEFFLAKLGMEGANMNDVSPSNAVGYSQLFDAAVIEDFRYVLNNNINEGVLYKYAKSYRDAESYEEKKEIIDEVKFDSLANLEGGIAYASLLQSRFVDWSLVSAAYQIGPSKLAKMIHYHRGIERDEWWPRIYIKEKNKYSGKIEIAVDYDELRGYVLENSLNIYDLLNNQSLMKYYDRDFKGSYDRFKTYPFWVLKTANDLVAMKNLDY